MGRDCLIEHEKKPWVPLAMGRRLWFRGGWQSGLQRGPKRTDKGQVSQSAGRDGQKGDGFGMHGAAWFILHTLQVLIGMCRCGLVQNGQHPSWLGRWVMVLRGVSQGDLQQDRDRDRGQGRPGRGGGCGHGVVPDAGTQARQDSAVRSSVYVVLACSRMWLGGRCFVPSRKPPGAAGSLGDASKVPVAIGSGRQNHVGSRLCALDIASRKAAVPVA